MRIAILGGPGSGKGTQAKMLSERYRVPQISTGDLLREAAKNDKSLGKEVKKAMVSGNLVDDKIVLKLLEDRLRKKDTKRGFIIDGYPRNIPQAQALDTLLGMLVKTLQISINIEVDDDALIKRIIGRVGCDDCGAIYNRFFSPPQVKTKCDDCGAKLVSRADDTAKTAEVRIGVYHQETAPLITYYRAQHKLRTMSGIGDMDEIHEKLCELIDLEIRPLEMKTLETASDTNDETDSTVIAGGQINRVALETPAKKPGSKKKKKAEIRKPATKKKVVSKKVAKKKIVKKKAAKKKVDGKKARKRKITKKPATKKPSTKKSKKKSTHSKKPSKKKLTSKKTKKKAGSKKKRATKKKFR